jgi:DNA repair exonuclease SbcCD ATPase subunit
MRVRKLSLVGFMKHDLTTIDLPPEGLVLVTGENGAGKSALVEGVAVAGWGKTLRGTVPWQSNAAARMTEVIAEGVEMRRSRGNRTELVWKLLDDGTATGRIFDALHRLGDIPVSGELARTPSTFENATQAQAALERVIGTYDVWRRSCVFSSTDAAHFSLATDAERKRLLEAILGLDRFDIALDACRTDLRELERLYTEAATAAYRADVTVNEAVRRKGDAAERVKALKADMPPELVAPSADEIAKVSSTLRKVSARIDAIQKGLRAADREVSGLESDARSAARDLERLSIDKCPTCEQPMPVGRRDAAKARCEHLKRVQKTAASKAEAARLELEDELTELEADRVKLDAKVAELRTQVALAEERQRARDRASRQRGEAIEALVKANDEVVAAETAHAKARQGLYETEQNVKTQRAVEQVLGLKGVRAHVLAKSLTGIEAIANVWLAKLGLGGLQIALKPYVEKKGGGVTDAIGVQVFGAGGEQGYRAASTGERRRIDLALLFGIGEIAAGARALPPGTLFVDELFDGLDVEGVTAVATAMQELARDRCVVVITHDADLQARFSGAKMFHVKQGAVTG